MSKLLVPSEVMEKIKCLSCKNYLSVFPIYTKTDGSGGICGRCPIPIASGYIRDEAFANIAQYLAFPCTHEGCKQEIFPKSMRKHESCCSNRKYECLSKSYTNCDWKGPLRETSDVRDMLTHFKDKHSNLLLTNCAFKLSFLESEKKNMLVSQFNEYFVVKKEVDVERGLFFCTVEHLKDSKSRDNYLYYFKFESGGEDDYFYRFPENPLKANDRVELTLDFLKERLHNQEGVIVNIKIITSMGRVEAKPPQSPEQEKTNSVQWQMLSELECPVCLEYMLPPIYQCLRGHSICRACKARLHQSRSNCPTCKTAFQNTRNFSLERLSQVLVYPCKYQRDGCTFSAKSTELDAHDTQCEFGPIECPLRWLENQCCIWTDSGSKVVQHIRQKHEGALLKECKMQVPFKKEQLIEDTRVIIMFEKLFKIYYKYSWEKFYWAVKLIGPYSQSKSYKFEVDVVDLTGENKRFFLMGNLSGPITRREIYQTKGMYLMATLEQLSGFIKDDIFLFKIKVVKI